MPNKARDLLGIVVDVKLHTEADLPYLELAVQAYPNPISYRGRHFMRSGSTLQELKGAALDRFLLGRHGRTWDGVPLPQFGLDHVGPGHGAVSPVGPACGLCGGGFAQAFAAL